LPKIIITIVDANVDNRRVIPYAGVLMRDPFHWRLVTSKDEGKHVLSTRRCVFSAVNDVLIGG